MFRSARPAALLTPLLILCSARLLAQPASEEVIARIKEEGQKRSQVMQTLSALTDVIGPRLTGSPQMKRANEWTRDKMTEWGLKYARLEPWGPFGRGWTLERFSAQIVAPYTIPLVGYPKAWSPGVKGTFEVVYIDAQTEADLDQFKGKLRGAVILNGAKRDVRAHFTPQASRWADEDLQRLAESQPRARRRGPRPPASPEMMARFQLAGKKMRFFREEGAALVIDPSRGDGGNIFVQSASVPQETGTGARRISAWDKRAKTVPQMAMSIEHFNRLARMLEQGEKLKMAVQLEVKFHDRDQMAYNTLAEIPGSDRRDEIVMAGAHLDSWHGGTGATDNAAGCAVVMEAARILQALNLQPRRTIRVALWSGEEQGLFGSEAYVKQHFAERPAPPRQEAGPRPAAQQPPQRPALIHKPDYEKFSAYYNLDNGTGKIRGIYAQGNAAARPLFQEWLAPFKEMGAATVTLSNTGSTDHIPFDAVGLPGFQFIQDEIEYSSRTHHSTQDVYERIQEEDMKQAAVIIATFLYHTAMRDELLPRKPLPRPEPPAAP